MKTRFGILHCMPETFPLLSFVGVSVRRFISVTSTFLLAKYKLHVCMLHPTAW